MSEQNADQLFLGRQAILDREQRLFAYELLFRNGTRNSAEVTDGVQATATVIVNAFAELGVEAALGSYRGFINVDEEFLFSDMLELLPRQSVVLEILETVPPSPAVVERCKALKAAGFTLALDDVIQLEPRFAELLALVDIVKVDIQPLSRVQLMQLTMKLKPIGKQLLAEKVDSREQMEQCLKLGFSLFQGYYFAKPTIIAGKKLDHSQLSLMKLMGLLLGDAATASIRPPAVIISWLIVVVQRTKPFMPAKFLRRRFPILKFFRLHKRKTEHFVEKVSAHCCSTTRRT